MNDPSTRQMIDEACAQADAAIASEDAWRATRAAQREPVTKSLNGGGLIYKRREDGLVSQQPTTTMAPELQRQWDAWVQAHINNALAAHSDMFADLSGEWIAQEATKPIDSLRKEIAELRKEVAQLKKRGVTRGRKNGS